MSLPSDAINLTQRIAKIITKSTGSNIAAWDTPPSRSNASFCSPWVLVSSLYQPRNENGSGSCHLPTPFTQSIQGTQMTSEASTWSTGNRLKEQGSPCSLNIQPTLWDFLVLFQFLLSKGGDTRVFWYKEWFQLIKATYLIKMFYTEKCIYIIYILLYTYRCTSKHKYTYLYRCAFLPYMCINNMSITCY